ncbi:hypothetical protein HQ590_12180 [bacterium]|nr:hypothetical protein [bacterium]
MNRNLVLGGVLALLTGATSQLRAEPAPNSELTQLKKQLQRLEKRVSELETVLAPVKDKIQTESRREALRNKARERMLQDRKVYNQKQLGEIEELYQVANNKWRSPEAKLSLEKLVDKYAKANRTGCALLYLGQFSEGKDREAHLRAAIANHSDCWYGDGVQVGPYARYYLAHYYHGIGKKAEAARLDQEIREQYPEAIDHRGQPLAGRLATDGK